MGGSIALIIIITSLAAGGRVVVSAFLGKWSSGKHDRIGIIPPDKSNSVGINNTKLTASGRPVYEIFNRINGGNGNRSSSGNGNKRGSSSQKMKNNNSNSSKKSYRPCHHHYHYHRHHVYHLAMMILIMKVTSM